MDPFNYIDGLIDSNLNPANNIPANSVETLAAQILNVIMGTAISLAIISTVIAGIKYIVSKGDPKAAGTAKNALTYAILALILALGAFTARTIVRNTIGATNYDTPNSTSVY